MAGAAAFDSDYALNLALAMVASSNTPLLLLDGGLRVIAASLSFCDAFHIDPSTAIGRPIFSLGEGEWAVPQLRVLLEATASGGATIDAYEMDLAALGHAPRRLVLNARNLVYGDASQVRLLLAVADVTEARASARLNHDLIAQKDQLLREKAVLLQEIQHRVANSLQIIASVLLQSARKVRSEESRIHLNDAHNRVMSIAAVQRQLADSQAGAVALRPYLTQLCQSLGASMIRDHDRLSVKVAVDEDVSVDATASVSLGLIVTELVINALKHGYPDDREGTIRVTYQANGPDWVLTVADDGVGMPSGADAAKPGLGTGIVEALAGQLRAKVGLDPVAIGTTVSLRHRAEDVADADADADGPAA